MIALFLLAANVPAQVPASAGVRCDDLLRQARAELRIDYRSFDQKENGGWRKLRSSRCAAQALSLIDEYLARRGEDLRDNQKANLNFHAAQVALSLGLEGRAQFYLGRSLLPTDTSAARLDWNSYVRATYAFVVRDRLSFNRHHRTLSSRRIAVENCSAGPACTRNDSNLPAVERLRACWGEPYRIAYYGCSPTSAGDGR